MKMKGRKELTSDEDYLILGEKIFQFRFNCPVNYGANLPSVVLGIRLFSNISASVVFFPLAVRCLSCSKAKPSADVSYQIFCTTKRRFFSNIPRFTVIKQLQFAASNRKQAAKLIKCGFSLKDTGANAISIQDSPAGGAQCLSRSQDTGENGLTTVAVH